MQGRYGIDKLYIFMFYLYFIILIINLFLNSIILNCLEIVLIIIMFYRLFSKNIYKRKKEENKYIEIKNKILGFFKKTMIKKDKNHIYKRCNNCHTLIRLPLPEKIGIKHVICPKCKKKNRVIALRKLKVELIRKNS